MLDATADATHPHLENIKGFNMPSFRKLSSFYIPKRPGTRNKQSPTCKPGGIAACR